MKEHCQFASRGRENLMHVLLRHSCGRLGFSASPHTPFYTHTHTHTLTHTLHYIKARTGHLNEGCRPTHTLAQSHSWIVSMNLNYELLFRMKLIWAFCFH